MENPSNCVEKQPGAEIAPHQVLPPAKKVKTSSMDSSFPVLLPEDPCLRMSDTDFEMHVLKALPALVGVENAVDAMHINAGGDSDRASAGITKQKTTGNVFVDALDRAATDPDSEKAHKDEMARQNRMLTTNGGMAYASTQSPLLELFNHVGGGENDCTGKGSLGETLKKAWQIDALMTLKVIWAVRSIHLGKGERKMFYTHLGWLGQHHPRTLLLNLKWLYRPVVKKDAKEREGDKQVIVGKVEKTEGGDGMEVDDYDVTHGSSHGYWKDLLNVLVLSAEDKLDMSDPDQVLLRDHRIPKNSDGSQPQKGKGGGQARRHGGRGRAKASQEGEKKSPFDLELEQKAASKAAKAQRHEHILDRLATDPFHRALHLTVARLFAEQLRKDMILLESSKTNKEALREISLCAKWAPSLERFHDKYTLIASTIAELLFSDSALDPHSHSETTGYELSREAYLKRAREQYRANTLSPLRKALAIVERDISAKTFSNIEYSHVPSLAMNRYKHLFNENDGPRFMEYLGKVGMGEAKISGAVLTPGLLVKTVMSADGRQENTSLDRTVADMQWKTLVQRIRDSGNLNSAMAVCDVSGSMNSTPYRRDISPLHDAIGLSLVMAEVTQPPFGGRIITFSRDPEIHIIQGTSLTERVENISSASWGYNTDFIKVFRQLILPLAVENKVPPEDMIKRVFVFSDMQFDEAETDTSGWCDKVEGKLGLTHQQIVQQEFRKHGYDVPELIYWNLAGNPGAVPVTSQMEGTALVSGQSQALMKLFLEDGVFGEEEEDDQEERGEEQGPDVVEGDGDGEWGMIHKERKTKRKGVDPMSILRKLVGNEAFEMLRVVD
ncbi:DUF2828 domain-containing protein [Histoplasma capsulatum var. duboisii H88]|uniref:DUF2828 domain-containing protein n=1 Tax=Ajellomyces capsulatus (strain H88) TaxID=544711 RepID=A0A8A1LWB4_AJEC8|nr:DUF2828 domain-containing protein [Histoplasma capsulatum var. duboisii H88]